MPDGMLAEVWEGLVEPISDHDELSATDIMRGKAGYEIGRAGAHLEHLDELITDAVVSEEDFVHNVEGKRKAPLEKVRLIELLLHGEVLAAQAVAVFFADWAQQLQDYATDIDILEYDDDMTEEMF